MYKTISALKVRQNLGQVMNEVSLRGDEYIVERAGKPLVAIIPIEKYQSMEKELEGFFEGLEEMRANLKTDDSIVMDDLISEAVQSYRKGKAKKERDDVENRSGCERLCQRHTQTSIQSSKDP